MPTDLFKPMLSYGRGIIFVNVLAAIQHQTDLVMISRWQGLSALGVYQLAGRIPEATVAMIYRAASNVLLPAFSRVTAAGEDPKGVYLAAARYVGSATLPVACGLAILAEPFVLLFFGAKWIAAAPIVSALAILTGLRAFSAHPGDLLKATGRVGLVARLGFLRVTLIVIAVVIAARYSALAVAIALVIVDGIAVIITFAVTARAIGMRFGEMRRAFTPSLTAAAVMSGILLVWLRWGPSFNPILTVIVGVTIGAVAYLATLRFTDPLVFIEARQMLFARKAARTQP